MQQKVVNGQNLRETSLKNKDHEQERSNKYRKDRKQESNLPQFVPRAMLKLLGRT